MELATSLPETGNLGNIENNDIIRASLMKSSSMMLEPKEEDKDEDEDEDEEDESIKPFGKIRNSVENINKLNNQRDDYTQNSDDMTKEDDSKIELEYVKVLKSYLPFHLQNYLENLEEEEADTMKTNNVETFCVIAAIGISEIVEFINHLQSKGKPGSNYLKEEINKYFCDIIDFITENKGDILYVTEKALVICWTVNENELDMIDDCSRGDLTFDAIKVCIKLIEQFGTHTFEFEDYKLDYVIRIGMDAGMNSILYIEVEKNHLWQYLNEGSVITQAYSVLNYNKPGIFLK